MHQLVTANNTYISYISKVKVVVYLGEGQVLVETNLKSEHQNSRRGQSETEEEDDKWTDERVEDKVGKVFHDLRDKVYTDARVEFSTQLNARQEIDAVSLVERGGKEERRKTSLEHKLHVTSCVKVYGRCTVKIF